MIQAKTDRRSRQGLASRRKILDATFDIAQEVGYQGTSIAKVSARCGLPASSVYWHFADKDALFAEVIRHSFDRWNAIVGSWELPQPGEVAVVVAAERIRRAVDSIATSPEFWRLGLMLALERQEVEPEARRSFIEIRRAVLNNMAAFWRGALDHAAADDTGVEAAADRAELLARFTMATADGIFVAAQVDGPYDHTRLAALLADSLTAAVDRLR